MNGKTKKYLCLLMSFVLFISVLSPICIVVKNNNKKRSVSDFCGEIKNINKTYNVLKNSDLFDANGKKNFSVFENRLIIKSDTVPKNNASYVYNALDYVILQYSSKEKLENDFNTFNEQGYKLSRDTVFFADEIDQKDDSFDDDIDDASYINIGVDYARNFINNSSKKYKNITVGIVDTGVDTDHPFLKNRLVESDINFSTSGEANNPEDDNGHGTMCAGIIANSTTENVKIKAYKLLDKSGSATLSEIVAMFEYIINQPNKPDILNMSFGGYGLLDGSNEIQNDLLTKIIECGIVVCNSAGNEGTLTKYHSPNAPLSINVSSCNAKGQFSDFSCYGDVDICAPGENVSTTALEGQYCSDSSGTSFSTPFVSSACAYILMLHPDYSPQNVKSFLCSNTLSLGEDDAEYFGAGIVNFAALFNTNEYQTPQPNIDSGLYHQEQTIEFDIPESTKLIVFSNIDSNMIYSSEYANHYYTEPITVSEDCVLNYALVKDGVLVSPIRSSEYKIQYYASESDFKVNSLLATITEYIGDKLNIIVPDSLKVNSVYREAFKSSKVKSIVLPDKITTLGTSAFEGSALKHIVAEGVQKFSGKNVFYNCSDMRDEIMPNLKTVSESAFYGCKKLHSVDFGDNITELKSSLFEKSGLNYISLKNANVSLTSNTSVFESSKLFKCDIPKIDEIGNSFFKDNKFLYELNMKPIKTIRSNGLSGCEYLKNFDVSTLQKLYSGALSGCYIENFYAPDISMIENFESFLGENIYCCTLNFPNFSQSLKARAIRRSTIKYLYFDLCPSIDAENAIVNSPWLDIMYFPSASKIYLPSKSTSALDTLLHTMGIYFDEYASLNLLWAPNTEEVSAKGLIKCGLMYLPEVKEIEIKFVKKAVEQQNDMSLSSIAVSKKLDDDNLTITKANNVIGKLNVVSSSNIDVDDSVCKFVPVGECRYIGFDSDSGNVSYSCSDATTSFPFEIISPLWYSSLVNKTTDNSKYMFLFDFTNDNYINAKDFSVYSLLERNIA